MAGEILTRHIEKFDGKNYQRWKFQLDNLFVAYDIKDVVGGTRFKPANLELTEGKT